MKLIGLAVVTALLLFRPAIAPGWQTYVNERFGSTADVPAGWRAGTPPENGDGLTFAAPDGQATIAIFGSLNVWDKLDEAFAAHETAETGETITYKHRDKRGTVVSGTKGDRIFYRKSILSCRGQVWNNVAIEYQAAEKQAFDAIVSHIAASLRSGKSAQVEECNR
jgi:serine/threonine-protein kinase